MKTILSYFPNVLILFIFLSACGNGPEWRKVNSGTDASLSGLWVRDNNDVWSVGNHGTILHWDGNVWQQEASGTTHNLYDIWGADDEMWAVGDGGTLLKWTQGAWQTLDLGINNRLDSVWGIDKDHIWVVGFGVALHYHDETWDIEKNETWLRDIWGQNRNNLWAVGSMNNYDLAKWNGETWVENASEGPSTQAIWGSDNNNIWFVGGNIIPGTSVIRRYQNNEWTTALERTDWAQLNSIWGAHANDVWAVGSFGMIVHFHENKWERFDMDSNAGLWSVLGTDEENVWAVGNDGTILHYGASQ